MMYIHYPKCYKPLPPGYRVYQLDSGHYMWVFGNEESEMNWNRYVVRRQAFEHYKNSLAQRNQQPESNSGQRRHQT